MNLEYDKHESKISMILDFSQQLHWNLDETNGGW